MVSITVYRKLALSFPGVTESPHFDRTSFRVNKKIFTTLAPEQHLVMVKLTPVDQSVFCAFDPSVIYPVPGSWGKGGATYIDLKKVKKSMLADALTTSFCTVAPKALREQVSGSDR